MEGDGDESKWGESVVRFVSFERRDTEQGLNNGRTNGEWKAKREILALVGPTFLTFAQIRSVELISTGLETGDARTFPARLPRSGDSDL